MVWPAFGTVYKIGQMKMLELRARAETKLGRRFSARAFHSEVLRDGALPLPVQIDQMKEGLSLGQVGQRPFEMGYKTMLFLKDIK